MAPDAGEGILQYGMVYTSAALRLYQLSGILSWPKVYTGCWELVDCFLGHEEMVRTLSSVPVMDMKLFKVALSRRPSGYSALLLAMNR